MSHCRQDGRQRCAARSGQSRADASTTAGARPCGSDAVARVADQARRVGIEETEVDSYFKSSVKVIYDFLKMKN